MITTVEQAEKDVKMELRIRKMPQNESNFIKILNHIIEKMKLYNLEHDAYIQLKEQRSS